MKKPYTIILCEDEEFVSRSYIRKLELEGFTVIHARNGKEGVEAINANKPALVILDLMMPIQTGFEVLQEIRNSTDAAMKDIPILVASNLGQQSDIDEATRLGATDFLIKSNISLRELIAKVRQHLPDAP